MFFTVCWRKC